MADILVTGAAGAVGTRLTGLMAARGVAAVATDIRLPPEDQRLDGITYEPLDVRDRDRAEALMRAHGTRSVVHLASIVTPGGESTRAFEYSVDVEGTRAVLDAALASGVTRITVTSSGAAYGYHADNPAWLTEDHPVRGNREFAYSWHKRLVEEMLAEARITHPALEQVVLRVGTVLGARIDNQITALFKKPRLLGVRGSDSPFVFIWDEDLAEILLRAAADSPPGIYNVAGDGALSLDELARRMGKPCLRLPAALIRIALFAGKRLGLTRYGPEQVGFLQYRPVLDNTRLKEVFGYTPQKSSAQAFDAWLTANGRTAHG